MRTHCESPIGAPTQLGLFDQPTPDGDIESRIQALLARRRAMNVSGQGGEDIHHIRAAFAAGSPTPNQ